ncbi:hypothetical protein [Microcella sp.]|uniref:hypothetical protein n=1 Tax=Microcella sp. TaxID=1913979 RepID=UPI00391C40B8
MATTTLEHDTLTIRLAPLERLFAVRGDLTLPVRHIHSAESVPDGLAAVTGLRAPGLGVPGWAKYGTWRRRDGGTVALVRGRGPALRIRSTTGRARDVLVSTPHAAELAAQITAARTAVGQ